MNSVELDEIYRVKENEFGFTPEYRPKHWLQGFICGWHACFHRDDPEKTMEDALARIEKWKATHTMNRENREYKKRVAFTKYHYID